MVLVGLPQLVGVGVGGAVAVVLGGTVVVEPGVPAQAALKSNMNVLLTPPLICIPRNPNG